MCSRAKFQSVVRVFCGLSLCVGFAVSSFGQYSQSKPQSTQLRPVSSARSYGGWTQSQPSPSNTTAPVQRASYYQQLGDALPSFPDALPIQPMRMQDDGGALVNSLSDLPGGSIAPPPLQGSLPDPQFSGRQGNDFSMRQADPMGPNQQFNSQYDNGLRDNGDIQPVRQRDFVPVSQAAYQSGSAPVLPQQQPQYQQQQQYQQQENNVGGTYLRSQEFATGLPHVTPPPKNNPNGNFLTSPYMGRPMYMNASYQRTTTASYPNQAPANSRSNLPQYLPPNPQPAFSNPTAPGVYPVGYPQQQCAPTLPPDGAMGAYVPPTVTPNWNPNMYSSNNSGYRPLLALGQENYNAVLGRGILGQPTAYVPGQYIRNFLRYIFP